MEYASVSFVSSLELDLSAVQYTEVLDTSKQFPSNKSKFQIAK